MKASPIGDVMVYLLDIPLWGGEEGEGGKEWGERRGGITSHEVSKNE